MINTKLELKQILNTLILSNIFRYFDNKMEDLCGDAINYDENGEETKHKRKYKWSLDDLDGKFYTFCFHP